MTRRHASGDANTSQQLGEPLPHDAEVYAAGFSADGARIVTASFDKTARISDATTLHSVGELRHKAAVNQASFSTDGARIATASADNTARIWDANTGQQVGEALRHVYATNGARIITASGGTTAQIWFC